MIKSITAEQQNTLKTLISDTLDSIFGLRAALLEASADDMIYSIPECLCIKKDGDNVGACGARWATPLPAGLSFRNGAGTSAVRVARRVALQEELNSAVKLISIFTQDLNKETA